MMGFDIKVAQHSYLSTRMCQRERETLRREANTNHAEEAEGTLGSRVEETARRKAPWVVRTFDADHTVQHHPF